MMAANTADNMIPAAKGEKIMWVMTRKTVSQSVPDKGAVRYTLPTKPTMTAALREMATHVMAMRVACFNSRDELMAMKRTRM